MAQFFIRSGRPIALLAAAGLALAACEREDPAGDALQSAHIKLASLSPFGTTLPAGDTKLKTYNEIINSLQPAVSGGTPTQVASASLLIAQAQMGQTEPAAAKAGELERSVLTQFSAVRTSLAQYTSFRDSANAAASYDPAKDLAEIERQDKEKSEQIKTEQAAKAAIEKQAADLTAQARAKADAARAKRQEAGALRQQVAGQTAVQGEQTLIQWQKLSREADALDVEAARLEAEANKIAPRAGDVQNSIDRLTKQRALLAEERTEVGRRTQTGREQASQLRAEAAKAADEIAKAIDAIHALRTGELAENTTKAIDGYTKAAGTASKAVKELKGSAQMVVGAARQALGETLLVQGRGFKVYAQLLDSLAGAGVPGEFKARADEAKAQSKEAFDKAFEAYQAADTAYNGAGATGEAKKRLEKLNAKFIELIEASGGSKDLIQSRAQPDEETPAAPTETPATASSASPQDTIRTLLDPNISASDKAPLFLTANQGEADAVAALLGISEKGAKLNEAVKAKFGQDMSDMGAAMGGQSPMGVDPAALAKLKVEDINVTVNGETAEAAVPGFQSPWKLQLRDGSWKVEFASYFPIPLPPDQMQMFLGTFTAAGKAMDELTAEVQAGKYADPQAVMQALMQKIMQGAMQQMNPGGG